MRVSTVSTAAVICAAVALVCPPGWFMPGCVAQDGAERQVSESEQLFVRRVLPILRDKCLACHGMDESDRKGGLDLRSLEAARRGGDSEIDILAGPRPEDSPLYRAVTRKDDQWSAMPPKDNDALSTEQIEWLREWLDTGSAWPDAAKAERIASDYSDAWATEGHVTVKTSGGLSKDWTNRRYDPVNLWAYQPLRHRAGQSVTVQQPAGQQSVADAEADSLDQILASSNPHAPSADRRTLIRRATFELWGLPPTPEEITAFVGDEADDRTATATLIERLLASPHYGERMAQHWLDVVRYADTSGFANDYARGSAWRFRDYVVRAFNSDKSYDQFIREQLAGDELNSDGVSESQQTERLIATGFLRMGPWELTGMEVAKVARQRFLDDVTQTVGETFLGHAMQCARCHDHKFDPIPTRDYYSLQAVFATTQLTERPAAFLPSENTSGFTGRKYLDQRQDYYQEILAELDQKSLSAAELWFDEKGIDRSKWAAAVEEARGKTPGRNSRRNFSDVFSSARQIMARSGVAEDQYPPKLYGFRPEDYGRERIARKGLERLRWEQDRFAPYAFAVYSGRTPQVSSVNSPIRMPSDPLTEGELELTTILTGGDVFAAGERVLPAGLSAVDALAGTTSRCPDEIVGRRRALADWIASPQNPLTARVMVNRIWLWHFGEAIAGNPNNFGATGKKPADARLLDWLAAEFIESGWSVKAMHRLILNSDTWQAACVDDAETTACVVHRPRRLTAEELRDAMLRVSGELNPEIGGVPVRPELNPEVAFQPRQVMGTFAEAWQPSPLPSERHRRTLYVLKIRGLPDPFGAVFDAPNADLSCEARSSSIVTPQVFAMFNSQDAQARSLACAARLLKETPTPPEVLDRAFQLAFGRPATDVERSAALAHWQSMTERHRELPTVRTTVPAEILREAVEENTGERFTFREPLEAAADFQPDLQAADVAPEVRGLAEVCLVLFNSNEFVYVY